MTPRQQEINTWLSSLLPNADLSKLQTIQADASQRKYLRLPTDDATLVIMDTKPDQEMLNFNKLAKILDAQKLSVPKILHADFAAGLLIMTDLGSKTYADELRIANQDRINSIYLDAITAMVKMQQIKPNNIEYALPIMDHNYIQSRLEVFATWYLQKHLGLQLDKPLLENLHKLQHFFTEIYAELPQVFVHVDYHCRNLMVLPANNPGILDFQDAMWGPPTYDLVSLFQDAYITWPRSQVESWIITYKDIAVAAGIMPEIPNNILIRNFDLIGLHRHIKNLGVFARLHHRDQKPNYLPHIPTLLKYIYETCAQYKEIAWLTDAIPCFLGDFA